MTPYRRLVEPAAVAIAMLALGQPTAAPGIAPGLLRTEFTEASAPNGSEVPAAVLRGQSVAARLSVPLDYRGAITALDERRCRRHPTDAMPVVLLLRNLAGRDPFVGSRACS